VGRPAAHQRVVRNILKRYLLEDRSFWSGTRSQGHHIPHFLLNDFARLWRTMAVDFAYKLRARSGEKWALRNVKLRMSRKLLYVAGLLACFRCHVDFEARDREALFGDESRRAEVIDYVNSMISMPPLDIVAGYLINQPRLSNAASKLFGSYDGFLGTLSDSSQRKQLEDLPEESADSDLIYQKARHTSYLFRLGLHELFLGEESELRFLTLRYGVF
jgi:hypothetical protein